MKPLDVEALAATGFKPTRITTHELRQKVGDTRSWPAERRNSAMFLTIFGVWAASLAWFGPRLWTFVASAETWPAAILLGYFAVFSTLAWLYGFYNLGVVTFAAIYRNFVIKPAPQALLGTPPVALLYTCCNDFVEESAETCMRLDYPNYRLYILDDSSSPACKAQVDAFAARYPAQVEIIRRADRSGFKAGNLNNALRNVVREDYFAIVDADEIVPGDFISKLLPYLQHDAQCGFVQANHRAMGGEQTRLQRDMGLGIDVHWKWYQPLRNKFGFVMFLGHGALLRRSCWNETGGFEELVSEDLAYAITIRERGYYGVFAEDVVCGEAFPETVRAFRIRHVKWTRGTCEFLRHWTMPLIRSRNIPWKERMDILFPTANLPLTFFFFMFMVAVGIGMPLTMGHYQPLTAVVAGSEFVLPTMTMPDVMLQLFSLDFFIITVMTLFAPVLCFILEHWREPARLFAFLAKSTALYAALSPLSALCVLGYALTGKARFLVTGDKAEQTKTTSKASFNRFISETHPDSNATLAFELAAGAVFLIAAILTFQIAFAGLALAFILQPVMQKRTWNASGLRRLAMVPFIAILASVALGGSSFLGVQPVFMGFGFHF